MLQLRNELIKLIKHTSQYSVTQVIVSLLGLISMPILTRTLSLKEYGVFSLITTSVLILVALAKAGLQHSTIRFYGEYKTHHEGIAAFYSTLFYSNLAISLAVALIIAVINLLISEYYGNSYVNDMLWIISCLIVLQTMIIRIGNFFRAEQRTILFNTITFINRALALTFGIGFLFFFYKNVKTYFTGVILADLLLILIVVNFLDFKSIRITRISPRVFKEILSYGIPLTVFELSDLFVKFFDRYLIQWLDGLEQLSLYSVAHSLNSYVAGTISLGLSYSLMPIYMDIYARHGPVDTEKFLSNAASYISVLSIPIVFGLSALGGDIITILASSKYAKAGEIVPFLAAGLTLWGFLPIFAADLYISKRTWQLSFILLLGSGLNILLNLLLIPQWGIKGAAVASLATYCILIYLLHRTSKQIKISVEKSVIVKSLLASTIMFLSVKAIPLSGSLTNLFIAILVGLCIYFSILTILVRDLLHTVLGSIWCRNRS